jgi:hypothetical protein
MNALPARNTDPVTSHEGTISEAKLREQYVNILSLFFRFGKMPDVNLVSRYRRVFGHSSSSGIRTRRSELVGMGRLENTGEFAFPVPGSKRRHIVWGLA